MRHISVSDKKPRVDFNAPASLVERADSVSDLLDVSRIRILVEALETKLDDVTDDETFRKRSEREAASATGSRMPRERSRRGAFERADVETRRDHTRRGVVERIRFDDRARLGWTPWRAPRRRPG